MTVAWRLAFSLDRSNAWHLGVGKVKKRAHFEPNMSLHGHASELIDGTAAHGHAWDESESGCGDVVKKSLGKLDAIPNADRQSELALAQCQAWSVPVRLTKHNPESQPILTD